MGFKRRIIVRKGVCREPTHLRDAKYNCLIPGCYRYSQPHIHDVLRNCYRCRRIYRQGRSDLLAGYYAYGGFAEAVQADWLRNVCTTCYSKVRKPGHPFGSNAEESVEKRPKILRTRRHDPWWEATLEAFGHQCAYCGVEGEELTKDHKISLRHGGTDHPTNLIPACRSCNSRKGAKSDDQYRRWLKRELVAERLEWQEVSPGIVNRQTLTAHRPLVAPNQADTRNPRERGLDASLDCRPLELQGVRFSLAIDLQSNLAYLSASKDSLASPEILTGQDPSWGIGGWKGSELHLAVAQLTPAIHELAGACAGATALQAIPPRKSAYGLLWPTEERDTAISKIQAAHSAIACELSERKPPKHSPPTRS